MRVQTNEFDRAASSWRHVRWCVEVLVEVEMREQEVRREEGRRERERERAAEVRWVEDASEVPDQVEAGGPKVWRVANLMVVSERCSA